MASPPSVDEPGAMLATHDSRVAVRLVRLVRLLLGLFLFVGALQLLKTAAAGLDVLHSSVLVENAGTALGLGWIGALLVLSGSPVAATALALAAAGEEKAVGAADRFTELQGFTMLTGSRLGAAFVVLVTAVVWALREGRGGRMVPLSTAVIALVGTAVVYVPAAPLGGLLLTSTAFSELDVRLPAQAIDVIDVVYGDVVAAAEERPAWLVFVVGMVLLLVAFKVIDGALPHLDERSLGARRVAWLQRKWPMFGLGALVALVTMSVSVALTVLVPIVSRGHVRRENILPYIFGANIATLGDTMVAAFALGSPAAVRIVLAEVIATSIVSVILLVFFYAQVRRGVWAFQLWVLDTPLRLLTFTAGLFLVPAAVIAVSAAF